MGIKSNYNKRNIMKIKMTASILVLALSGSNRKKPSSALRRRKKKRRKSCKATCN